MISSHPPFQPDLILSTGGLSFQKKCVCPSVALIQSLHTFFTFCAFAQSFSSIQNSACTVHSPQSPVPYSCLQKAYLSSKIRSRSPIPTEVLSDQPQLTVTMTSSCLQYLFTSSFHTCRLLPVLLNISFCVTSHFSY